MKNKIPIYILVIAILCLISGLAIYLISLNKKSEGSPDVKNYECIHKGIEVNAEVEKIPQKYTLYMMSIIESFENKVIENYIVYKYKFDNLTDLENFRYSERFMPVNINRDTDNLYIEYIYGETLRQVKLDKKIIDLPTNTDEYIKTIEKADYQCTIK